TGDVGEIIGNTIYGSAGTGIEITSASTEVGGYVNLQIRNNTIAGGGTTGIAFTGSGVTQAVLTAAGVRIESNAISGQSVATYSANCSALATGTVTTAPTFANVAGGDYTITNLDGTGYPAA